MKPWFKLKAGEEYVRRMTREQYYAHHRYLRVAQRMIERNLEKHQERIEREMDDLVVYGTSPAMAAIADIKKLETLREEYPADWAEALRWFAAEHWFD